jgi:dihydrodipicolinate synthase/N-acetylneuraminate lyase
MSTTATAERERLKTRLFPGGIPTLWCPLLTHYAPDGAINLPRMAAHLAHLSRWVTGYLIPGSTGDGWELTDAETRTVLDFALGQTTKLRLHLLIGVLKADAPDARQAITQLQARFQSLAPTADALPALSATGVRGFTVCAPRGAPVSQEQMADALGSILALGLPVALYQLPQITQNEFGPELAAELAGRFANYFLLKDSSGADRVAMSGKAGAGVFLVRGAEGEYARWLRPTGGPYDGLLLSTANCFARELAQMVERLAAGRRAEAEEISARLTSIVKDAFRLVADVRAGNAFANANKAMDHFFAHGPKADRVPPPRLHAGVCLPIEVIRATGEALARHDRLPSRGYLE